MRFVALLLFCSVSVSAFADNIIVNGTRFIFPGDENEITVQLSNTASRPAIAQVWLDNGDPNITPDKLKTPFIITPPISRIDTHSGQTIRIKLASKMGMPADRETLWWLNLLDVPPMNVGDDKKSHNILQIAIRSRFKFFYRPSGLGDRDDAPKKITIYNNKKGVTIKNPTPFYITVSRIAKDNITLNKKVSMLSPFSIVNVPLSTAIRSGETLEVSDINDYGAENSVRITVK